MGGTTKRFLLLLLVAWAPCAFGEITEGDVPMEQVDIYFTFRFPENNEEGIILFKSTDKLTLSGTQPLIDVAEENNLYLYKLTESLDYETISEYSFKSTDPRYEFTIILENVDDNAPVVQVTACTMDEFTDYTKENSPCKFQITDVDQMNMKSTKFSTEGTAKDYFDFVFDPEPQNNALTASGVIVTLKQLDYEIQSVFTFLLSATDSGGNVGSGTAIVNVGDLPNLPPMWSQRPDLSEVTEHENKDISISAYDGDRGIKNDISFSIKHEDSYFESIIYLEDKDAVNDNKILIRNLDRDEKDLSNVKFTLIAKEKDNQTELSVQFYVVDIDDNVPEISYTLENKPCESSRRQVRADEDSMEVCENYNQPLMSLEITDIDTGLNAQFSVELDMDSVFQMIPGSGYRTGTFSVAITNVSKLDYELDKKGDDDMKQFALTITSIGTNDPKMTDQKKVTVNLKDYNDESPIFTKTTYEFIVDETVAKGVSIGKVEAQDYDEGDVITYTLEGSSVLEVGQDGSITVKVDSAFDYDIASSITFTVKATDAVGHVTPTTVTLNLIDINNKPPKIEVSDVQPIYEDMTNGEDLNFKITASSTYKEAELAASILWSDTKFTKNYVPVLDVPAFLKLDSETNQDGSLSLRLIVSDQEHLDYETYDTVALVIQIENVNFDPDFEDVARYLKSTITITLIDVNDNDPEFTDDTKNAVWSIIETATAGISPGTLSAFDKDVTDNYNLRYTLESKDDVQYDYMEVDSTTGTIKVREGQSIDCDTNKIFFMNYTASVFDPGNRTTSIDIKINIVDMNTKIPTLDPITDLSVDEDKPVDTEVLEIKYQDADRDSPNNIIKCELSNDLCKQAFKISYADGVNKMLVRDNPSIDREEHESIDCKLECTDNPDQKVDQRQNTVSQDFTVTLNDVNDNPPDIPVRDGYTADESLKKDGVVAELEGSDRDAGKNAYVDFALLNVWDASNNKVDWFDVKTVSAEAKTGQIVAKVDLNGRYGDYIVNVKVTDQGEPALDRTVNLTLTIEKYNFYALHFLYPTEELSIDIQPSQSVKEAIKQTNGVELSNLLATYYKDETACDSKWDVEFTVTSVSNDAATSDFTVDNSKGRCQAQLQVTSSFQGVQNKQYTLTLTAAIKNDTEVHGEATTAEITMQIKVFEVSDPYFEDVTELDYTVLEAGITSDNYPTSFDIPAATYGADTTLDIYYRLESDDFFTVSANKTHVNLKLVKDVDYLEHQELTFNIKCSKNDQNYENDNPQGVRPVKVTVKDVNNHAPEFKEDEYIEAITVSVFKDPVFKVEATDDDTVYNKLSYELKDLNCKNSNVDNCAFSIDQSTGGVSQNFELKSNMNGYFTFTVTATDEADPLNPDSPFTEAVNVRMIIIIDENIVGFRFMNTLAEVSANYDGLIEEVNSVLYSLGTGKIINYQEDTDQGVTTVSFYFIDKYTAQTSTEVLKLLADIKVFKTLRDLLAEQHLTLLSFLADETDDDLTAVLRAWLIAVSVILGTLCIVFLVVFVLKTRSLKRQINRLTNNKFGSDESMHNREQTPNTNKFAVEGQNPIFSVQREKEFDAGSIASGDSELIGVEDNADFSFASMDESVRVKNIPSIAVQDVDFDLDNSEDMFEKKQNEEIDGDYI